MIISSNARIKFDVKLIAQMSTVVRKSQSLEFLNQSNTNQPKLLHGLKLQEF